MDVSTILEDLNKEQREAVSTEAQSALIIAGAGSGKTRVLIHRIAWLCSVQSVPIQNIVAVTFTNKAASEIRERLEHLLRLPVGGMWLGTFHSLCFRLLRRHWQEAELPRDFQILDAQDQRRLVKRTIASLRLDENKYPAKKMQYAINRYKEAGQRPQNLEVIDAQDQSVRIYTAYEEACKRSGLVDFTELLLRSVELIRDNDSLRAHYHRRFRVILIDEFQDTDALQYAWLRNLAGEDTQTFVVGDDDQSIYSWRGARVENIDQFRKSFSNVEVHRLERNYRSTKTILSAANALIQNNENRVGKQLWTEQEQGDAIQLFTAFDEREEARFVIDHIKDMLEQDYQKSDMAILYRSNAQSRVFEETLLASGIDYRVYGGLRFFERAVIKDALAYLRLAQNSADDVSFARVVNTPPRGIGARTVEAIRTLARQRQISLAEASHSLVAAGKLLPRAIGALAEFHRLIDTLAEDKDLPLGKQASNAIELSGLRAHYLQGKDEKSQSAVENLDEFIIAASEFEDNVDDIGVVPTTDEEAEEMTPLSRFLTYTALEAGERQDAAQRDCVQLMTLHSAKGLEFDLVFMVGMEEGLFPHSRSLETPGALEEERRLCYVGITRAQRRLVMTYALTRRYYQSREVNNMQSRFIFELPSDLLENIKSYSSLRNIPLPSVRIPRVARLIQSSETSGKDLRVGSTVKHQKFGEGVVLDCEGSGDATRVQVKFAQFGVKWLVLGYANLELVGG